MLTHPMIWKTVLSTHDLTQRSTIISLYTDTAFETFNSRPHAEVDQKGQCSIMHYQTFNSRPHAEVDETVHIPQGAHRSFNSRPHAEVDRISAFRCRFGRSFNSRPHAEVDGAEVFIKKKTETFNSRPHAEVDINISHILCKISILFLIFFTKTTLNKAQKYEYYFIFAKINC